MGDPSAIYDPGSSQAEATAWAKRRLEKGADVDEVARETGLRKNTLHAIRSWLREAGLLPTE